MLPVRCEILGHEALVVKLLLVMVVLLLGDWRHGPVKVAMLRVALWHPLG